MKKWLVISVAMLLLVGIVSACGPDEAQESEGNQDVEENENTGNNSGEEAEEAAESDMPEKPEKLVLWVNDEEVQIAALETMTENYKNETDIEVELIPVDMLDQVEKLDLEGPAGNGPDIIFQPHDRIGDLRSEEHTSELQSRG